MSVGLVSQTKVAVIVRGINSLLHGAQQHGLQHRRVGPPMNLFGQFGIVFSGWFFTAAQTQADQAQIVAQILQLLFSRPLMHPIQGFVPVLLQEISGTNVGRQHALFNQAVRVVAHNRHDAFDLARVVEDHLGFHRIELDRPALAARRKQHLEQRVQGLDLRQHRAVASLLNPLPNLVISQPRLGQHHRWIELIALDHTLGVDLHIADHAHSLHIRIQRADPVGQGLRQHRNDAARKIDRSTAIKRFLIQSVAGLYVKADVGNRHDQTEALALLLRIHGIIEVARGFTVYRHQGQITQVDSILGPIFLTHLFRCRLCLRQRCLRELMRQIVLTQRDLDFHSGIGVITQHFHYLANRLTVGIRILKDFHHDYLAVLGTRLSTRLNQNVMVDAAVFRRHHPHAPDTVDAADQPRHHMIQHLYDLAFLPASAIKAGRADHHPIAMHRFFHFPLGQENISALAFTFIRDGKTVAIAVTGHFALDQVQLLSDADCAFAIDDDFAVSLHCPQATFEINRFSSRNRQHARQFIRK